MESITIPPNMRIPSLEERTRFYARAFDPKESKDFIMPYNSPVYAIDLGNESGIYNPDFKRYITKLLYITNPKDLSEKLRKYSPEDVYYSRNLTKDPVVCSTCTDRSKACPGCSNFIGQELAFDIDPENIECRLCARKMGVSVYSFCTHQLAASRSWAINLYKYLKKENSFSDIRIVYSGRGYHLHVLDKDAYTMPLKDRKKLAFSLKKKGYPIDEWVTSGKIDLIRLPGSLHGLVNRIVKEIKIKELERFDPLHSKEVIPVYPKSTH
ncbi:MAG: hypothetical protein ABIG84_08620 [archaeon]